MVESDPMLCPKTVTRFGVLVSENLGMEICHSTKKICYANYGQKTAEKFSVRRESHFHGPQKAP